MQDFWKYIKGLFDASEQSTSNQPAIHEIIVRTPTEKLDFQHWKDKQISRRMLNWFYQQYKTYQSPSGKTDHAIAFLNTPSSKGFVIYFHQMNYSKSEVTHFFDFLKEKVLTINYYNYVSDTRTFNRPEWVETIQRHYLKPSLNFQKADSEKFNQQYGNIKIELEFRNDQVHNLRFSSTTYNDHLFDTPEHFNHLIDILFSE